MTPAAGPPPLNAGFASLQPNDADYAVQVCREQDPIVTCRVSLRLEPEHPAPPRHPPTMTLSPLDFRPRQP
jgi:hypothetical protein